VTDSVSRWLLEMDLLRVTSDSASGGIFGLQDAVRDFVTASAISSTI
jgi:hypothetical protein